MPAKKRGRRSPGGKKRKADGPRPVRRLLDWFRDALGAQLGDVYGIGLAVLVSSILGLWHLMQGTPDFTAGATQLRRSGGIVGAVLAGPLNGLMSVWGAAVVLVALLCLGVLILTKTPVRRALEVVRDFTAGARERHGFGARAPRYEDDEDYQETDVIDLQEPEEEERPPPTFVAET